MYTDDIEPRLGSLYGDVDWAAATGILHVAAIGSTRRRVIIPGPDAPASETDRFVLGLARARADAIVTSGAVLRSEPALCHDWADDLADRAAFARWRLEKIGKQAAPKLIVLTASGRIPVDHPALAAARGGFIWTTEIGADRLGPRVAELEVIAGNSTPFGSLPGLVGALGWARSRARWDTILVESGPASCAPLYLGLHVDGPPRLAERDAGGGGGSAVCFDELLLSRFEGVLAPAAVGPEFVSGARLEACFGSGVSSECIEDESGRWSIDRYRRRVSNERV